MKQIVLAFLLIVSLDATAQIVKKKPVRKVTKADSTKVTATGKPQAEAIAETQVEEEAPVMEEMVAIVEAPISDNSSRTFSDGDGLYYLSESFSEKGISIVYKGDYSNRVYAIIETATKKKLTPFIFENIRASFYGANNTAVVTVNGKSGTINSKGQMIIPCIYDLLNSFTMDDQTYYIATLKNKVGIITETSEIIFPFEYTRLEKAYHDKPNIFLAQKGDLYGLVNVASKKIVVPIEYSSINTDSDDYLRVAKDNLYTLINWNGKPSFKNWYSYLNIYDDFAIAELNGHMGVIDLSENKLLPFEYDKLERINSNTERVYNFIGLKDGKYGMCSMNGNVIIPFEYDRLSKTYSSFISGTKNGLKGLFDLSGKVILPFDYGVVNVGEKAILLKKENKYGIIKRDLTVMLPMKYDYIKTISMNDSYNTYYLVMLDGKTGICNSSGKMVLDVLYDDLLSYNPNGRNSDSYRSPFIAVKKGKYGVVESSEDADSKIIIPFEYDELDYINSYLVIARKNGKYGIRTIYENTIVLPFEYQSLSNKGGNLVGYKGTFEQYRVYGKTVTPVSSSK
ncbi:WG containing repeat-containing protein [Chitinophaga sp. YR573]|uniref:WG repeat-containing protein n=1 Tax=Chitinophaga sp. YR573 TaxID=1881040 RepID=UPI0008B70570|nr:WG repeat-containing protein [Chitinophaga sp. YR573]SEW46820.1 WG containing repeat-containing protein [Chitinophaga sp. YR573]